MIAMHTSLEEAFVRTGFDEYDIFLRQAVRCPYLGECVDLMIRGMRRPGRVSPVQGEA